MSSAATFHAQLASIMEVLANTAVAEICELVDSGYSVLQLEISRSRKENEVLRRKLRLMELRAARASALRAAATAGGTALLHGTGRARAQLLTATPTGGAVLSRVSNQERARCRNRSPSSNCGAGTTQRTPLAGEITAVIKVEDDDDDSDSWTRSESDSGFGPVAEGQTTEAESSSPLVKQEAADNGGVSSWTIEEVTSTSTSSQKTLTSAQTPETSSYDAPMFEPQLQHGSHATQNPLGADPGCSSGPGSFPFSLTEVTLSMAEHQQPAGFHSNQQRAALPADELTGSQSVRRQQDSAGREEPGGKSFVCNHCGKTLACLKNLKTHMRVHTGEKPFVCTLCGKRFSDSSNLKRHHSVHTGEKRYGCVHCGKRFAQSGSLKVHMTVHTDCKQFRCSFCGKTFISGSHLRRHVIVHAGEKRQAATAQ